MTRHPRRVLAPLPVLLTLVLGACGSGGSGAGPRAAGPPAAGTAASSPATTSPAAATSAVLTVEVAGLRARDEVHIRVGQRIRVQPPLARDGAFTVAVTPVTAGGSAAGVVAPDAGAGPLGYRATRAGTARLALTTGPICSSGGLCPSYRRLVGSVVVFVGT